MTLKDRIEKRLNKVRSEDLVLTAKDFMDIAEVIINEELTQAIQTLKSKAKPITKGWKTSDKKVSIYIIDKVFGDFEENEEK